MVQTRSFLPEHSRHKVGALAQFISVCRRLHTSGGVVALTQRQVGAVDPTARSHFGGRGGIRTHGGFNPTLDFESSALNRTQPPFLLEISYERSILRSLTFLRSTS